ncbi:tannase/feruloyl esterase family alpha/beta hydrolase [Nostoc sp.]|uniref:tannase/feruloyl esterase family alpha/beta hydrolase n=1 Tax=Nostoc sp. TaxID=1180 RepID=UPI002FFD4367
MRYRRLQSLFRDGSIILRFSLITLVFSVLLLSFQGRLFQTSVIAVPMQSMPSNPCSALMQRDFAAIPDAPTAIVSAQIIPSKDKTLEYCEVKGYVTPQIQFEVRLPTQNWNRRYLQVGCGGYCGSLNASPECITALNQNFAVAFDNTGHIGGGIGTPSALWGLDQPQLRADFGYRSEHVTALAAKAIATAFYSKSPSYSYFQGCSNGGRQALMLAQRYPNDFNGIIAGAPAAIQAPLNGEYETWNERANQDSQGNSILSPDKLVLIHQAAIANCDGQDGLLDGQITDPRVCTFKPESLRCSGDGEQANCLTTAQIAVVKKLYGGVVDSQGRLLYPGSQTIGSELGWAASIVTDRMPPFAAQISNRYLKYLAFSKSPPPSFSYKDWQFTVEGFNQLRPLGKVYNATNPNLKAFRDRGGKLILYHGWSDPAIPPQGTIAYYQAVQDTMGGLTKVQSFARLFMLPGMYHCQGGTNPSRVDWLIPMVAWVEQGTPPTKIIASQKADDSTSGGFSNPTARATSSKAVIIRTRPIFPYPMQAKYQGKGSIDNAANFVGIMPSPIPSARIDWIGNDLFEPQ